MCVKKRGRIERHLLRQTIPTKHSDRHSGEGRNPEERPPLVHMDPGLRRDDGAFSLKEVPFGTHLFFLREKGDASNGTSLGKLFPQNIVIVIPAKAGIQRSGHH